MGPENTNPKKSGNKIQIGHKRKIALVFSGGAAKAGAFHLGVALALQEQGFKFYGGMAPQTGTFRAPGPMEASIYVGSSAGSIISTYLAAGYSLENIFNSFLSRKPGPDTDPADLTPKILPRLTYQKMFKIRPGAAIDQFRQLSLFRKIFSSLMEGNFEALFQLKWLKATGIFSTVGIEQYMREEVLLSNKFQDYMADLFIVATQLNHSRKVVFGKYSYKPPAHDLSCQYDNHSLVSEAVAASTALPVIFSPYAIKKETGESYHYLDGEIRDTLSTHIAEDAGADLVIASYTHQPYHYQKAIGSLTEHGLPSIVIQTVYLMIEQKIKNAIHNKDIQRNAINAVSKYFKDQNLPEEHRRRVCDILEAELHHRMAVDSIYIHPSPDDAALFLGEHFSLSPKKMSEIVRSGFRAAIETLKHYEFADRKKDSAIGQASQSSAQKGA